MKIILIINLTSQMAGAEESLLLLGKHLGSRFRMILACPSPGPLPEHFRQLGITTRALPPAPVHKFLSPLGLLHWLYSSLALLKIILTARPDIIHANSFTALTCALLPARLTGKPLIVHARDFHRYRWLTRLASLCCSQIIAVSHAVKTHLIAHGVKPDKITVVYNGVEPPDYTAPIQPVNGQSGQPFTFAHIGQFVPWKSQLLFLHAAAAFLHRDLHARFMLIGDDIFGRNRAYTKKIHTTIKELNLTDRLTYIRWQADMIAVWPGIDCLVHTAAAEPFGRIIVEAIANGIPVIAVNRCGPVEILQNHQTAILIEPNNLNQLTAAMFQMAGQSYPFRQKARSATRQIAQNFSAEKTAAHIAQIYNNVLKGSSHAHRHHFSYV